MSYIEYHAKSYITGDIDPAYPMLEYICDRFELNTEQRYWLSFLYGCCYCGPTVFYIYNEFPDYENVDVARLTRWWYANKSKLLFQTDRLRIRSNDQFIPAFVSYRELCVERQSSFMSQYVHDKLPQVSYDTMYTILLENVKYFGRYSMFLWLECMHRLTGIPIQPTKLNWKEANNCLNGLLYANMGLTTLCTEVKKPIDYECKIADSLLISTMQQIRDIHPTYRTDIWNVETTLCAYYKYLHGKRYVGFYRDRQMDEINIMETNTRGSGVCWDVLHDFRKEYKPYLNTIREDV
jgi:hypothetical protein